MKKILKSILIATASIGTIAGSTATVVSCAKTSSEHLSENQKSYNTQLDKLLTGINSPAKGQYGSLLPKQLLEFTINLAQTSDQIKTMLELQINRIIVADSQMKAVLGTATITFDPTAAFGNTLTDKLTPYDPLLSNSIGISVTSKLSGVTIPTDNSFKIGYVVLGYTHVFQEASSDFISSLFQQFLSNTVFTFAVSDNQDQEGIWTAQMKQVLEYLASFYRATNVGPDLINIYPSAEDVFNFSTATGNRELNSQVIYQFLRMNDEQRVITAIPFSIKYRVIDNTGNNKNIAYFNNDVKTYEFLANIDNAQYYANIAIPILKNIGSDATSLEYSTNMIRNILGYYNSDFSNGVDPWNPQPLYTPGIFADFIVTPSTLKTAVKVDTPVGQIVTSENVEVTLKSSDANIPDQKINFKFKYMIVDKVQELVTSSITKVLTHFDEKSPIILESQTGQVDPTKIKNEILFQVIAYIQSDIILKNVLNALDINNIQLALPTIDVSRNITTPTAVPTGSTFTVTSNYSATVVPPAAFNFKYIVVDGALSSKELLKRYFSDDSEINPFRIYSTMTYEVNAFQVFQTFSKTVLGYLNGTIDFEKKYLENSFYEQIRLMLTDAIIPNIFVKKHTGLDLRYYGTPVLKTIDGKEYITYSKVEYALFSLDTTPPSTLTYTPLFQDLTLRVISAD